MGKGREFFFYKHKHFHKTFELNESSFVGFLRF